jgi:hypothetical protein
MFNLGGIKNPLTEQFLNVILIAFIKLIIYQILKKI